MKRIFVKISLVVAMGLMLISQGNAQSSQGTFPFLASVDLCGELVDIEGEFHVVTNSVTSNSGNTTSKYHINLKGTGVGQTSGAIYQVNETINETSNSAKGFNVTFNRSFSLIGQGKAPNFKGNITYHITINANGELTAEVDNFRAICK
ncbi:hypothetical protein SAMN00777080_1919 [Aquiflexum balticum DSM 16537]|uniref:Uncharacterized protein n=1 Tax=Aquiflexum balticum DSM 16537 TaxID=758820 RepID=A0A1W2H377_9BACT|nr:hypothetical protein [Aquiflexum balticum]SMD43329.1 hypothetical protein SAMN00777080_1919 [Aquiflexum balticum DSM 16537]